MGCGSSNDVSSPSTSIKSTSKNAYKYSTFTIDGPSRSFLQRQYDTPADDDHEGVRIGEGELRINNTTAPSSAQLLGGKTKSNVSTGTNTSSVGTHLSVPYATHGHHNSNEGNNMFKTFKFPTEEELLGPQLASGRTSRATSGVTSPVPPPLLEGNSSTNSNNCKNEISLMGPNSLRLLAGAGGCFSPLAPQPDKKCSSHHHQMISVSGPPGAILSSIGSGSELGSCRGSCSSTPKSKHLTTNSRDQPYQGSMGQATMILMLGAPGETGGGGGSGFSNEDALVRGGGMGRPSLGKIVEEPDPEDERREKEAQIRMAKLKAQKHEFCAFTEEVEQKQALRSAAVTGTQDSELGEVERRKQAEVEQWTQSLRREETPDRSSS